MRIPRFNSEGISHSAPACSAVAAMGQCPILRFLGGKQNGREESLSLEF
ncbi:hypothetical protein MBLL_02617 [Methylobacterium bullatum]|uniref:Uncharacterized protein n=1 Tax=Methylobacterium bullatum TaxID=570505 RepID=A0A679KEZ8_9HYPH|nr:hypothetical protein MBLL_02617 [Methylobacterium bullatum]